LLSKFLNKKALRITSLGLFTFLLVWVSPPAYGAQVMAVVTCADSNGEQITRQIGWNNENRYFENRGNIPAHYCEGGFAGSFTTFVGVLSLDGSELDSSLLYFAGLVPTPTPSPEVSPEPSPPVTEEVSRPEEPVEEPEEIEPPVEPSPEPTLEPTPEPLPVQPEPTPEPLPIQPEPTPEPTPEETKKPKPEPKPELTSEPTPEPSVEPTTEPVPPIEPVPPSTEESEEELPALSVDKLLENLRNIGSDMTPEVREQAQQVVIASIIVSQIAITAIGRKP
jgi:hypothetical protein